MICHNVLCINDMDKFPKYYIKKQLYFSTRGKKKKSEKITPTRRDDFLSGHKAWRTVHITCSYSMDTSKISKNVQIWVTSIDDKIIIETDLIKIQNLLHPEDWLDANKLFAGLHPLDWHYITLHPKRNKGQSKWINIKCWRSFEN